MDGKSVFWAQQLNRCTSKNVLILEFGSLARQKDATPTILSFSTSTANLKGK